MDFSPPGSSVHGIFQAKILEWVAMPSSRGSSQPRDQTKSPALAGGFFTVWATRKLKYPENSNLVPLGGSAVNNWPAIHETWVWSRGREDHLEKEGMATCSGILAWRIPRMEEPGVLQSMGSQRVILFIQRWTSLQGWLKSSSTWVVFLILLMPLR